MSKCLDTTLSTGHDISIGLVSIGGRVWQDRHRFGQLVNTALGLRRKLGAAAVIIVAPILYFMLVKNGASVSYTAILLVAVLGGLAVQLSIGVLSVVPRLRSDIRRIQTIDLTGAVARLLALIYLFLNGAVALALGSATLLLQYWMLRKYVAGSLDLKAPENAEDREAMRGFIRSQAANVLLTLATQLALIPSTDFSSVTGVLTFNLVSAIPSLALNLILSYRGFRSGRLAIG